MIAFENVSFSYGARPVLSNVSFSIEKHERVAILGRSGQGKTTILRLMLGLVRPDAGRIVIDGEDITQKRENELRPIRLKFSMVFQEGALFDSLSVRENVAFYLRHYTSMSEAEIENRVKEMLRVVGLEGAMDLMPEELSGGMHRRVAIARSLAACEPEMFLYDEPTSALDPLSADLICDLITDLTKDGKGFILVTHKINDAVKVSGRFIFLESGKIVFDGPLQDLLDSRLPETQAFTDELCLVRMVGKSSR